MMSNRREIKFRAWIQKDQYSDDETPEMEMCCDLAFEEYLPVNDLLKGVEHLMQFTGLKDKNGKDIYEGDIVRLGKNQKHYEIAWSEIIAGFVIKSGGPNYELTDYEIIGNIYENPELLETK